MTTGTQREIVVFSHPFRLKGVDRALPSGGYEVITDEELIEGLSFPVYHRVSTVIIVPAQSHQASSVEWWRSIRAIFSAPRTGMRARMIHPRRKARRA